MDRKTQIGLIVATLASPALGQLHQESFDEIIKKYSIIGDFAIKPETRSNSEEVFWRYPLQLPREFFPIAWHIKGDEVPGEFPELLEQFPATLGAGRAAEHLNRGRKMFLEGDYLAAKGTLLGGRARYGRTYPFHRRNDYFTAYSFIALGMQELEKYRDYFDTNVKTNLGNASTFLAWAFDVKRDEADPLLEHHAPKAFYNQAAIYFLYGRWGATFGAVTNGLNFLRRTGRSEFSVRMQRLLAELHIINRSYIEAAQIFDQAIRESKDQEQVARMFGRLGDIYYDLNNFELAEDMYGLANRINQDIKLVNPHQFILRGESLFWLGRFDEALKTFHYGLQALANPNWLGETPKDLVTMAHLRIADVYLAKGDYQQAKLEYFRHFQEFRQHPTAAYARIRLACLELPEYEGNNIIHARNMLKEMKLQEGILPKPALEIAWTCEVASYAKNERDGTMIRKIREYTAKYPNSRFIRNLIEPVRIFQANRFYQLLEDEQDYLAIDFFEKTRAKLFPTIKDSVKHQLFRAYAKTNQPEKAREFWYDDLLTNSSLPLTLAAVRVAASLARSDEDPVWQRRERILADQLKQSAQQISFNDENELILSVLSGQQKTREIHQDWLYQTYLQWSDQRLSYVCDALYPILRDRWNRKPSAEVMSQVRNLTEEFLQDLIQFDTFCGYSLLSFEYQVMNNQPLEFYQRLQNRRYLTINRDTISLYWSLAENLDAMGQRDLARQLWQEIEKQTDAPESRFSKRRLDQSRTELEDLWQN